MNLRVLLLAGLLLTLVDTAGCKKEPSGPTILDRRAQSYIPDVPVPEKFERDERKSNYTVTAGSRVIHDVYLGGEAALAVRNFYQHHMPGYGWELLDEKLSNAVYNLTYRKGQERCEIRIERTPKGSYGTRTQISVTIQSQGGSSNVPA